MGVFELPGQLCMTAEAGFSGSIDQQCRLLRRVRVVTTGTLALEHRPVHDTLIQHAGKIVVTRNAEVAGLLLQQPGKASHVWVVSGETISRSGRLVLDPFLKCAAFMA